MSPPPSDQKIKPLPVWKSFAASATAACTAELLTIPLDTAKVQHMCVLYCCCLYTVNSVYHCKAACRSGCNCKPRAQGLPNIGLFSLWVRQLAICAEHS